MDERGSGGGQRCWEGVLIDSSASNGLQQQLSAALAACDWNSDTVPKHSRPGSSCIDILSCSLISRLERCHLLSFCWCTAGPSLFPSVSFSQETQGLWSKNHMVGDTWFSCDVNTISHFFPPLMIMHYVSLPHLVKLSGLMKIARELAKCAYKTQLNRGVIVSYWIIILLVSSNTQLLWIQFVFRCHNCTDTDDLRLQLTFQTVI